MGTISNGQGDGESIPEKFTNEIVHGLLNIADVTYVIVSADHLGTPDESVPPVMNFLGRLRYHNRTKGT